MAIAKITLIGMMEYLQSEGDDLFANFQLPPEIDKTALTDWILMHSGEFPVLWANPYFVKNMIGVWSSKNIEMFNKWVFSMSQEYNPIYNYDRFEEIKEKENTSGSGTGKDTHSVTGFDATGLQTNDQLDSGTSSSGNRDYEHNGHMYGNIGVTTSASMQKEFNELQETWNLYDKICELFTDEFCIRVF